MYNPVFTLKNRLITLAFVLLILLSAGIGMSLWYLQQLNQLSRDLSELELPLLNQLIDFQQNQSELHLWLMQFMNHHDSLPTRFYVEQQQLRQSMDLTQLETILKIALRTSANIERQEYIEHLRKEVALLKEQQRRYEHTILEWLELFSRTETNPQTIQQHYTQLQPQFQALKTLSDGVRLSLEKSSAQKLIRQKNLSELFYQSSLSLFVLASFFIIGFIALLYRYLRRQLGGELEVLQQIMQKILQYDETESRLPIQRTLHEQLSHLHRRLGLLCQNLKRLNQGDLALINMDNMEPNGLHYKLAQISQRLLAIKELSQAVARGDYSQHLTVQSEQDQLAQSINQMLLQMQQVTEESQRSDWLKTGQTELNERMRGEQDPMQLMQNVLDFLATYLKAQVGAFYLGKSNRAFSLICSYAYHHRNNDEHQFKLGEGLIGQAALEKKLIVFNQLDEKSTDLTIQTGLGAAIPNAICVLPLVYEQEVLGVLTWGSRYAFMPSDIELLNRVVDNIAIGLKSSLSQLEMRALLEESQKLTEELQNQQSEIISQETRIRAILNTVVDAIITIDEKGRIESFNKAAEKLFGYHSEEVINQPIEWLMPEPYRSEHGGYLQRYLATGQAHIIGNPRELMAQRKDGEKFPIDLAVSEMYLGERRLFTGIIRNITERKHAEEELRVRQAQLQTQNEEMQAQNEELQAQQEELQSQQDELRKTNDVLESKTRELEQQKAEINRQNKILQQHRKEIEIKAEELTKVSQYKSEFLANVSHELRTPLNSLLILAGLLSENRSQNLSEKQVEQAKTIYSSGKDLLTLIDEILDLSKIESGRMELTPDDIPIDALFASLKRKFQPIAESRSLAFRQLYGENIPTSIYTDEQRLQQVLKNLLSNAFKFTASGEVCLEVELLNNPPQLAAGQWLAFHVKDTGIGIPEDKQAVIFEAFKQLDGTISRRYGGTGLGLSISRQLAQLLGGELWLKSVLHQGSVFSLVLPLRIPNIYLLSGEKNISAQVEKIEAVKTKSDSVIENTILNTVELLESVEIEISESVKEKPRFAPAPVPFLMFQSPPATIPDDRNILQKNDRVLLLIDDDHVFLKLLKELANERGFKCLLAEDGMTGLLLAEEYRPSAIILDVNIPRVNGWGVMESLKDAANTRHIPVYFVSGTDKPQLAHQLGAIGFLLKPATHQKLELALQTIEEFIARSTKSILLFSHYPERQNTLLNMLSIKAVQWFTSTRLEDCYATLNEHTIDCLIIDVEQQAQSDLLSLLQETEQFVHLPIIIYTDKSLVSVKKLLVKSVSSMEQLLDQVMLFLHQAEVSLPIETQRILRSAHDREALLARKKVLIVDDDVRNTFALTTFLEEREMEVLVAENGRKGLSLLEENPDIAIVLMDIMMPEMDGYQATREIRSQLRFRDLPIIALTAKAMKGDRSKCIEAGASDYLTKPVDTDRLISLMRVWLYR
ncbi:response regulator [Thioflexithrix psekupsensis]|uniref:Sensor protein FixL n=1 Tax=Thioflexithrix psekupsensis TaxID=1570016 RepID=A0A251X4X5_9GAMM|nr:response regulator [Thioflexithrix psekupsensis]OUD12446.1 hypothetical protein TPSD3_15170 [Thioflexithrix psekupsensis]